MTAPTAADVLALLTPETLAALTPDELAIVQEFVGSSAPDGLVDRSHPRQAAFVEDDARFIVVMCTRRAGKSMGALGRILRDAYMHPGANYLFAGLTLDSAKKAVWKDGFKEIDARLGLNLKFNEVASTVVLPNQSVIYVIGMDSSDQQKRKARGGKYRGVVIDEAQDFASDLDDLIVSVMKPAVSDQEGWIVLAGTPGQVPTGLFYRVSANQCAEQPGTWTVRDMDTATEWKGHTWSAYDNPYMAQQTRSDIAAQIAVNPLVTETPKFKREWRGMWVTDDDRRVYRVDRNKHSFPALPKYAHGEWHYAIGVDLGFNDDTALTAIAWHDHDRCAYVVESESEPGFDITDTAQWIRRWMEKYSADMVVVDGANKQAVEEMRRRHNLPLIAADKREKAEFIDIVNAEFIKGNIRIAMACEELWDEALHLSWDERAWKRGVRKEDPRAANHKLDSLLYAYRLVYAYLSEEFTAPIRPNTPEWFAREERLMQERAIASLDDQEDDLKWLT